MKNRRSEVLRGLTHLFFEQQTEAKTVKLKSPAPQTISELAKGLEPSTTYLQDSQP